MRTAVFFDVDNTLLKSNISIIFIRSLFFARKVRLNFILKAIKWNWKHKSGSLDFSGIEDIAAKFLKDWDIDKYQDYINQIYLKKINKLISPVMKERVTWHLKQGHIVSLLSNTPKVLLQPLADKLCIKHILSSVLETKKGKYTGKFSKICYGPYKMIRMEEFAKAHRINLSKSYIYTDSFSDLPSLNNVGNPIAVNPDQKLRKHCKKHNWKVIRY